MIELSNSFIYVLQIQPSGLTLRNKDSYAKFGSTLWFTLVEVYRQYTVILLITN